MADSGHAVLLGIMLVVSFLFGAFWFISPLGFGFAEWPDDPANEAFARRLYLISYVIGLPLLAFGQVRGLVHWIRGQPRKGLVVLAVTFGLSSGGAMVSLALMP